MMPARRARSISACSAARLSRSMRPLLRSVFTRSSADDSVVATSLPSWAIRAWGSSGSTTRRPEAEDGRAMSVRSMGCLVGWFVACVSPAAWRSTAPETAAPCTPSGQAPIGHRTLGCNWCKFVTASTGSPPRRPGVHGPGVPSFSRCRPDRALCPQGRARFGVEPELGQHLVGVLAQQRAARGAVSPAWPKASSGWPPVPARRGGDGARWSSCHAPAPGGRQTRQPGR